MGFFFSRVTFGFSLRDIYALIESYDNKWKQLRAWETKLIDVNKTYKTTELKSLQILTEANNTGCMLHLISRK